MDITRENFAENLSAISETIKQCDFIAIDTELSGLTRERSNNRFDLPEERYSKTVGSSKGYFIMQFGLSCFTRSDQLCYKNTSYNFYIFPQAHGEIGDINRTLSLQAHCIHFLSEHGFDFNKLFKSGLSYLTFQEKKELIAKMKSENKARSRVDRDSTGLPSFVPNVLANNCRDWLKKVEKFVEENKRTHSHGGSQSDDSFDSRNTTLSSSDNRLELRDCCARQKRMTMRRVLESMPLYECIEIIQKTDAEKNEVYLVIKYIDKATKYERQKYELMMAKGFLEVLELIITNRKPLVGHNLSLDLIQIIDQFMEPLSEDYESFKETCNNLFPIIYDTKYIAHSMLDPKTLTNNQSRLEDLYHQLKDSSQQFVKIQVDHVGQFFDENQAAHQAGYDAYMSGYCFVVLGETQLKIRKCPSASRTTSLSQHPQLLEDFANKIQLSYSYDFKYFNLGGEEEEPDRSHVFYVEYPKTWTLDDIFQVFSQFGGVEAGILSRTSALCALRDPKNKAQVLAKAEKLSSSNYKIFTYDTYLEGFKPRKRMDGSSGDCDDIEFTET